MVTLFQGGVCCFFRLVKVVQVCVGVNLLVCCCVSLLGDESNPQKSYTSNLEHNKATHINTDPASIHPSYFMSFSPPLHVSLVFSRMFSVIMSPSTRLQRHQLGSVLWCIRNAINYLQQPSAELSWH